MNRLMRAVCALLIGACLPAQALANSLLPSDRWVAAVTVAKPLVPYKLGLVSLSAGGGALSSELPTAARSVLKQAGYFDNAAAERVHVDVAVKTLSGGASAVEYTARRGTATKTTAVIYKQLIRAQTENQSMSDEVTDVRVLAGNLKLFVLDFRKHFDPGFAQQAAPLIADVNEEVDSRGILSHVGEAAANTLVATVEGTAAVASTMGEVVASEEFQRGMVQVAGEYAQHQQQVAVDNARMASLQAAAARERETKLAAERAAAQQQRQQQLAANAQWAADKQRDAALYRQAQSDKAAQRTAELKQQREAAEQRQRQARADAQQRAAEQRQAAEEQARQRIADQQRADAARGALIVEQMKRQEQVMKLAEAPKSVQQGPSPDPDWYIYRNFPRTPKNLNCNGEQKCRSACPRGDMGETAACARACTARSTCKVSLQ